MPEITIEVEANLLPQLVVISAITEGPSGNGPYIENHCCMVRDTTELKAEVDTWQAGIQSDGGKIVKAVVRVVPMAVYWPVVLKKIGDPFALEIIELFVSDVCRQAEANIEHTGKLEGAHYAAMMQRLETLRRGGSESSDSGRWVAGEPGGPSGPFYSVTTSTGQIVAMQITDKWFAYLISQIPQFLQRRRRWASLINRLATLVLNGERSSNDINEANRAIAEVMPFIEPD